MASSSTLLFLTLAPLIFITTSNAITNDQINQICTKAISKNQCFQVLRSTSGVSSADLKGVGYIVLDQSNTKLTNIKSSIPSLVSKTTDLTLKKRYNACKGFFDEASSNVGEAKNAVNHNDSETMNIRVSAAQTYVEDCTDSLKTPPADPSDLSRRSLDVFDTLTIALVISNMI